MYVSRGTSGEDREGRVRGKGGGDDFSAGRLEWPMGGLESRSRRRGQRRRRWLSAGARASTDGRRIRSPSLASGWRGRSRNDRRVERRVELDRRVVADRLLAQVLKVGRLLFVWRVASDGLEERRGQAVCGENSDERPACKGLDSNACPRQRIKWW